LLERNPDRRITLAALKKDEFFAPIDWDQLLQKTVTPPIDISNFKIISRADEEDTEDSKVVVPLVSLS
jgi:hypothetical protein